MNYPVVSKRGKLLFKEDGELSVKDILRERVIDILGDPEQDVVQQDPDTQTQCRVWQSYADISRKFGYNPNYIWQSFGKQEIREIEKDALELRRQRYSKEMKDIDLALLDRAKGGDVPAIKLSYQRFEGWSEKSILAGDKDNPLEMNVTHLLDQVEGAGRQLPGSVKSEVVEEDEGVSGG